MVGREAGARAARRFGAAALPIALLLGCATALAQPPLPRVVVETTLGAFTIELRPDLAPEAAGRFLARAGAPPAGAPPVTVAPYAGTQVCESRAHGFFVFGCVPFDNAGPKPKASGKEPPQPDEIDGAAMGLAGRLLTDPKEISWLWQQEVVPRAMKLQEDGRPVPTGLQSLVDAVRREGTAATRLLEGKSRLWYLEALGYRFTPGRSPLRVVRGAVAAANFWPGEADERFLVALTDIPDRDGRCAVFGRVVDGWPTLSAIEQLPVDKSHRTLQPVLIRHLSLAVSSAGPSSPSSAEREGMR